MRRTYAEACAFEGQGLEADLSDVGGLDVRMREIGSNGMWNCWRTLILEVGLQWTSLMTSQETDWARDFYTTACIRRNMGPLLHELCISDSQALL